MKRQYNPNISARANACLQRREAQLFRRKLILGVSITLLISIALLLGSAISAYAKDSNTAVTSKYYTSIEVQAGDTLWSIAEQYTNGSNREKQAYVKELCELNHLSNADSIHSGQYLTVSYLSTEQK